MINATGAVGVGAPKGARPAARPSAVEPYLRGCAFRAGGGASYPRADPRDRDRLPADTWGAATIPAGVRLEFLGDAVAVDISYVTQTDDLGYRGKGAGTQFSLWRVPPGGGIGELVAEEPAALGDGTLRLQLGDPLSEGRFVVHLPEGMKPTVLSLTAVGGTIEPASQQPRWICYGDSIAEGWTASAPSLAWPAIAGRMLGLDVFNMGYAGAARGEIVSAQQIAALVDPAPVVISVSHGTNCWTRIPHSAAQMRVNTLAFLQVLRAANPGVPVVLATPVIRPDAESAPNALGATLGDLRDAMQAAFTACVAAGDTSLHLVPGASIIGPEHLADGIHPSDQGHRIIAATIGAAVSRALVGAAPVLGKR